MYNKILVPTDASEYSRRSFETALELARRFKSEIELLYVTYQPQAYWGYAAAASFIIPPEQIEEGGELALDATLEGMNVSGVEIIRKKIQGHPATVIASETETENIDLVVMGSHGYGPITGSVLGSVSQGVLQRVKCPVLIVK